MKRRKGLSVVHKPGKDSKKRDEEKSLQDLAASLRARRSEALETSGIGEVLWTECVEVARKEFVKGAELKKKRKEEFLAALKCSVMKTFFLFCNYGLKGLGILCIALLCIGLFLYLCKPASFFLQRKLHSRFEFVSYITPVGFWCTVISHCGWRPGNDVCFLCNPNWTTCFSNLRIDVDAIAMLLC